MGGKNGGGSKSEASGSEGYSASPTKSKHNLRARPLPQPGKLSNESMNILPPPVFDSEDDDETGFERRRDKSVRQRQSKMTDDRRGSLESLRPKDLLLKDSLKAVLSRDDVQVLKDSLHHAEPSVWSSLLANIDSNVALISAKVGAFKCLEWILANVPKGLDRYIMAEDAEGQTILHYAVINYAKGGGKMIMNLHSARSNILPSIIDRKNKFGWTCLMLAAYEGNRELCEIFLSVGASVQAKNNTDWTASDIALDQKHFAVVNLLAPYLLKAQVRSSFSQEKFEIEMSNLQQNREVAPTAVVDGFYHENNVGHLQRQASRRQHQVQGQKLTNLPRSMSYRDRQNRMRLREERFGDGPAQPIRREDSDEPSVTTWRVFSWLVTFLVPPVLLSSIGLKSKEVQQAWREKIALCFIIALMSGILAFLSFGLAQIICKPLNPIYPDSIANKNYFFVHGQVFVLDGVPEGHRSLGVSDKVSSFRNSNVNHLFPKDTSYPNCRIKPPVESVCVVGDIKGNYCHKPMMDDKALGYLVYTWKDVLGSGKRTLAYNGKVIDLTKYEEKDKQFLGEDANAKLKRFYGRDVSRAVAADPALRETMNCLADLYQVGVIDATDTGCFISNTIVIMSMVILFCIIFAKFIAAVAFNWILSSQLGKISRTRLPRSHVVLLVTCYSEGEDSLRTTMDSLTATDYNNEQKLLFVIADGNVTGSGNRMSTPDLCKGLLLLEDWSLNPTPMAYEAIGDGPKRINFARVYAGYYEHAGNSVPMILVEKCGAPDEEGKPKAGNRGKRDSQLILMHFFSNVTFNDRMTPLDYDLFWKIEKLTGKAPSIFDIVCMVDADTLVKRDSLKRMIFCMERDPRVMGLCGETKVANKGQNWVTWIQVYEYYISHHLGKSWESIFGGVTCLPGCFCMYRLKLRNRDGSFTPILANPDIVEEYSENRVNTLHKKNLLLLGEDRYLTTLMLRAFPRRNLIFVPKAICKTVVPDSFKVLLSQRRRWINSTIHNLLELVLVKELCGIFCCSMQFVVMLELIGTVVMPASFVFLVYLFILAFLVKGQQSTAIYISLAFFVGTLFAQAFLVFFTKRKISYLGWMLIYVIALPVWNFILPLYAFWHFDEFSWGATRKVDGPDAGHGSGGNGLDEEDLSGKQIVKRFWSEWETLRQKSSGEFSPSITSGRSRRSTPNNRNGSVTPSSSKSPRGLRVRDQSLGAHGTGEDQRASRSRSSSRDLPPIPIPTLSMHGYSTGVVPNTNYGQSMVPSYSSSSPLAAAAIAFEPNTNNPNFPSNNGGQNRRPSKEPLNSSSPKRFK